MEKSRVLIIYTGGTIGMVKDHHTGALVAFDFDRLADQVPELKRLDVELTAKSFATPVDSSEMNPDLWKELAEMIADNYAAFDGFVVLHGSDTMSYTASALSFMLQGLTKPIILTGSQLPIGTIRTDGKENLITAIEIAGLKDQTGAAVVQEVAIYFEYSLYRGNRTTKVSASEFEAFKSGNYPELAVAGVTIRFNSGALYRTVKKTFEVNTEMCRPLALIKLFPGIPFHLYASLIEQAELKGLLIETYGAGNGPVDVEFIRLLEQFMNRGGLVVNITQCISGSVEQGKYQTSSQFLKLGVIGGGELTTEAAVTKLMHISALQVSVDEKRRMMSTAICGEC
jgi:L-asparaginase